MVSDVTLMALGVMVHACLEAADLLAKEGLAARVVNLACLKPLDWELVVACARETGAVVTAEEHMVTGGLGSAVCEILGDCSVLNSSSTRVRISSKLGVAGGLIGL